MQIGPNNFRRDSILFLFFEELRVVSSRVSTDGERGSTERQLKRSWSSRSNRDRYEATRRVISRRCLLRQVRRNVYARRLDRNVTPRQGALRGETRRVSIRIFDIWFRSARTRVLPLNDYTHLYEGSYEAMANSNTARKFHSRNSIRSFEYTSPVKSNTLLRIRRSSCKVHCAVRLQR